MDFYNNAYQNFLNLNYKEAIYDFYKSILFEFQENTSYYNIGICYMKLNDYNLSIKIFKLLIEKRKLVNSENLYNLAVCYFNINDISNSILTYQKCLEIDNQNISSYINIAACFMKIKDFKEAIKYLLIAKNLNSNNVNIYVNLILSYNNIKEFNSSIDVINESLKIFNINNNQFVKNNLKYLCNNIGLTYLELRKYNTAIEYFNKCDDLHNQYFSPIYNSSVCHFFLGDYDKSIKISENIFTCKPDYTENTEHLIRKYFDMEMYYNILNLSEKFLNNKNKIFIALIHYIRGNYDKFYEILPNLNTIQSNDDARFILPYKNLLHNLSNNLNIEIENTENTIFHLGDSHSLSTTNRNILINGKLYKFNTKLIIGCKAWHLNNSKSMNNFKACFQKKINTILNSKNKVKNIIISIGEIDCREDEGILIFHKKTNLDLNTITKDTVKNYVEFLKECLHKYNNLNIIICNVPASYNNKTNEVRILFNNYLNKYLSNTNFKLVDLYSLTKDNKETFIDNHHLNFDIYKQLLPEYINLS